MKKRHIYTILAVAFMAILAVAFFFPDDIEGNVLQQHDTLQGIANGQEAKAYYEATGRTTRWTNSLFSGMPNFQIAPSYPANSMLGWIGNAFMLWLPSPAGLLFAMMLGFFIMCQCMKMKWHISLFASIAWAFSSYFIIIIGAGHIWKFVTLAYIPPTIGGIALLYRKKYLAGSAVTALFGALQLQSNHPQMTYYFLFVVLAMLLAWLWEACKSKSIKHWLVATACLFGAGIVAVAANSASLYNSYEYAKETVRGRATDLTPAKGADTGGMDRDAITAWSYGIDESFTLLIPNVKGGASVQPVAGEMTRKSLADTPRADELPLSQEERMMLSQFPQYFGDQPMTNGPVYVGAIVLLLAILAMFMVESPMKWALFGVSVLALLLSWGHNFPAFTNLMIDHFPGYNKFRAVASILVIVEFCVPLLAAMCIKEMIDHPEKFRNNPWTTYTIFGLGALVCLAAAISPSIFGEPYPISEIEFLSQQGAFSNPQFQGLISAISDTRLSLVRADALRSLLFIVLGGGLIWLYLRGSLKRKPVLVFSLAMLTLIDLFPIDRRYVNSDNFTRPVSNEEALQITDVDRAILRDTTHYRVLDITDMGGARSSYFHNTIGGYHAAKLTRYNDLLEKQISKMNPGVLNMLNAKYIIFEDQENPEAPAKKYQENPGALGNAWFVDHIRYVGNADAEMAALDSLNTAAVAVADKKFANILGQASPKSPGDTIYATYYAPDRISYRSKSAKGSVAVMSEIYFPWGWKAAIDGKPAEIGRVDYTLRAIKVPAGEHSIEFSFDPDSLRVTNSLGIAGVIAIYILCGAAVAVWLLKARRKKKEDTEIISE